MAILDPEESFAFSLYSSPSAYCLLLGSGISRAAGIPTGGDIVKELVTRIAVMQTGSAPKEPMEWYEKKYREKASYSKIIETLAKTPDERLQLLKPFFEPTDDERKRGLKIPSTAHKAVASLVESGHIKIILTTNFDRLLELALEEKGISPNVAYTSDAVKGLPPFYRTKCTILKVNGDYLDTRLRNTQGELTEYDDPLVDLLDRIFSEHGLCICGWSAKWDVALRDSLQRNNQSRFSNFWASRKNLTDIAKDVRTHINATEIRISDADSFLENILEKVRALETHKKKHPVTKEIAVASLERLLELPTADLQLEKFLFDHVKRTYSLLGVNHYPSSIPVYTETVEERVYSYNSTVEIFTHLASVGFWRTSEKYERYFLKAIEKLLLPIGPKEGGIPQPWELMRSYPLLLVFYSAGISCLERGKIHLLRKLFNLTYKPYHNPETEKPIGTHLNIYCPWTEDNDAFPFPAARHTRVSNLLFEALKEPFAPLFITASEYERAFDDFEIFFATNYIVKALKNLTQLPFDSLDEVWLPLGRFYSPWSPKVGMLRKLKNNLSKNDDIYNLIVKHFFENDTDKFDKAFEFLEYKMLQ